MRLMVITEQELQMADWKMQKVVDVQYVPVDLAAYKRSRANIHKEVWRAQEEMVYKYDPIAIEELEKRIAKLYAIINDLNKVINA